MIGASFEKYPLDWDALQKGDVISVEQLEAIFGVSRDHQDFWKKHLALRAQIAQRLMPRFGKVCLKGDHGAIRILTDSESLEFTERKFEKGHELQVTAHEQAMAINAANLAGHEQRKLSHNLQVQAFRLLADRNACKEITKRLPPDAKNETPPALADEGEA